MKKVENKIAKLEKLQESRNDMRRLETVVNSLKEKNKVTIYFMNGFFEIDTDERGRERVYLDTDLISKHILGKLQYRLKIKKQQFLNI